MKEGRSFFFFVLLFQDDDWLKHRVLRVTEERWIWREMEGFSRSNLSDVMGGNI